MRTIDKITWVGGGTYKNLHLVRSTYETDGSLALRLDDDHGVVSLVTINLGQLGEDAVPAKGAFWIKDYSEHKGLGAALADAGVVWCTGKHIKYGPWDANAWEYRLTPEWGGESA